MYYNYLSSTTLFFICFEYYSLLLLLFWLDQLLNNLVSLSISLSWFWSIRYDHFNTNLIEIYLHIFYQPTATKILVWLPYNNILLSFVYNSLKYFFFFTEEASTGKIKPNPTKNYKLCRKITSAQWMYVELRVL